MEVGSRFPRAPMHSLPRLAPEFYRGSAAVLWTINIQERAAGWLDLIFHAECRELVLHACVREHLLCPAYVIMPDHLHFLWMGLEQDSDQRNAMKFLRRFLAIKLHARSTNGQVFRLQRQSHDRVIREKDRTRGAIASVVHYLVDNPRRAGLVKTAQEWPFTGAIIPGIPSQHPMDGQFWPLFWKHYWKVRNPDIKTVLPPYEIAVAAPRQRAAD